VAGRPAIQLALLTRRPAVSLASNGADILAWTDCGWTGRGGVTDYGGVQDLDIVTIAAMLELLDLVPLSPKPGGLETAAPDDPGSARASGMPRLRAECAWAINEGAHDG